MILGPSTPQTHEGLWDLVQARLQHIERGLEVLRDRFSLDGQVEVDALLCDAGGRPVLLFQSTLAEDHELPSRILQAREWFECNARVLATTFGRVDRANSACWSSGESVRCLVVGFDFSAGCLQRLGAMGIEDVSLYRVETLDLDGQAYASVTPQLGPAFEAADSWEAPEGVTDEDCRARFLRLLDIVRRLDPEFVVAGDRYSRRCSIRGVELLEVRSDHGALWGRVPDLVAGEAGDRRPEDIPLADSQDVSELADRCLRAYLLYLRNSPATSRPRAAVAAPERSHALSRSVLSAGPRPLETIRARLAESEITEEEYDAFRDMDPSSQRS